MLIRRTRNNIRSCLLLELLVLTSMFVSIVAGCTPSLGTPTATLPPPTLGKPEVDAPTPLDPGQETGVSLNVSTAAVVHLTYEWKVDIDGGEIIRGQGSPAITYRAPDKPGIYKISVIVTWDGTIEELATFVQVGEGSIPTPTPTLHLTATLTPTLTQTSPSPPPPPPPTPSGLKLTAPPHGSTAERNPPKLQWQSDTLPTGYSFVVRLQHDKSKDVITSPELSTYQWTPPLPAEKHGWWVWKVQVVKRTAQGVTDVATSDEWGFWFTPFGSHPDPGHSPLDPPDADPPDESE